MEKVASMPKPTLVLLSMQKHCSFFQTLRPGSSTCGASLSLLWCTGHRDVERLQSLPGYNHKCKVLRCTNCSGCKECRQPLPLADPEGTGASGCSAEVAAQGEALRAAQTRSNASSASSEGAGTGEGSMQRQNTAGSNAGDGGNPALVECAVCHRKPGDPGVPATLKLCGGCQGVRYCSAECQRKDWKLGHKALCEHFSKIRGITNGPRR
jgi:hypothetical protein